MISVLTLLFGLVGNANATTYDVRFCLVVDIDYSDDEAGDFWTDETVDRKARGAHLQVEEDGTGGSTIWEGSAYVDAAQGPQGCTPLLQLDSTVLYDITAWSEAEVRNVTIRSFDNPTDQNLASGTYQNYSPSADETFTLPAVSSARWNHLAAAALALQRHDGGLASGTLRMYTNDCCYNSGGDVYLGGIERKFIVGHEIGHWMTNQVNGGLGLAKNCMADTDDCQGDNKCPQELWEEDGCSVHTQLSKEYQTAAAIEGLADWYAAITWNEWQTESDCGYMRAYGLDWNDDGEIDTTPDTEHACHGDPSVGENPDHIDDKDWLEDLVNADDDDVDGLQCDGTLTERSTQFDWLRYLWSMIVEEEDDYAQDIVVSDIWAIVDCANPHNWSASNVITRWENCADSLDFSTAHDNQKDHGLDH